VTASLIAKQFEFNHRAAHRNLSSITHEESLVHPTPGGNCANWVLGHIVATRNLVMQALGEPEVWTTDQAGPYQRGATAPLAEDRAERLEDILAALDRSQSLVITRIGALQEADMTRTVPAAGPLDATTLGERLVALSFHEAYHVGQFGLLRRLLGKAGAIA
jgi:uncharacterized damage-inducible protein DinB